MLRMIIADDEVLVREGIRNIVNWTDYGIRIIGEASEGNEAFELCLSLKPDILFTDVRMPFLDGLQVARKLKDQKVELKVIIFSGIQDFNYAKTALDVNAEGYILKPLEVDALDEVVKKVVKKIEADRNKDAMMQRLRGQLKENWLAACEKFLRSLLLGKFSTLEEISEKLEYFDNPFNLNEGIIVATLTIDDYNNVEGIQSEIDRQLLNFAITNISDELIRAQTMGISFYMTENEFILILNWKSEELDGHNQLFESISFELGRLLGISVSIGISSLVKSVLDVPIAFKEAKDALQFRFYTGKNSILNIADVNENYNKTETFDIYETETNLINAVKLGDVLETDRILSKMFEQIKSSNTYRVEYVQNVWLEIIFMISRTLNELGKNLEDILSDKITLLNKIQNLENIFELEDYMRNIMIKIAAYFSEKYIMKNDRLVSDIKDVICKEYMKNINVNKIAQTVFLSPNYISLIFKKETGETITDYLTRRRMDAAKELLRDTDLLIQQIAEMVGYEDASYFSKVFKKTTGIYPLKYRTFISN